MKLINKFIIKAEGGTRTPTKGEFDQYKKEIQARTDLSDTQKDSAINNYFMTGVRYSSTPANSRRTTASRGSNGTSQRRNIFQDIEGDKALIRRALENQQGNLGLNVDEAKRLQQLLVDMGYDISFKDRNTGAIRKGNAAVDGRIGKKTLAAAKQHLALLNNANSDAYEKAYRDKYGKDAVYNNVQGRSSNDVKQITNMLYNYIQQNPDVPIEQAMPWAAPYLTEAFGDLTGKGRYLMDNQQALKDAADNQRMLNSMRIGQNNVIELANAPWKAALTYAGGLASQLGRIPGVNPLLGATLGMRLDPKDYPSFGAMLSDASPNLQFDGAVDWNTAAGRAKESKTLGRAIHDSGPTMWRRGANLLEEAAKIQNEKKRGVQISNDEVDRRYREALDMPGVPGLKVYDRDDVSAAIDMAALVGAGQLAGHELRPSVTRSHNIGLRTTRTKGPALGVRVNPDGSYQVVGGKYSSGPASKVMTDGTMPRSTVLGKQKNGMPTRNTKTVLESESYPLGNGNVHGMTEEYTIGTLRGNQKLIPNGTERVALNQEWGNPEVTIRKNGIDYRFNNRWTSRPAGHRVVYDDIINNRFLVTPPIQYSTGLGGGPRLIPKVEWTAPQYNYEAMYTPQGRAIVVTDPRKPAGDQLMYYGGTSRSNNLWADQPGSGTIPVYVGDEFPVITE